MESPEAEKRLLRERKRLLVLWLAEIAKYNNRRLYVLVHKPKFRASLMQSFSYVAAVTRYSMLPPSTQEAANA